ncbi:MAG: hypothetical protein ACTJLK_01745 [Anaplasma sp.]
MTSRTTFAALGKEYPIAITTPNTSAMGSTNTEASAHTSFTPHFPGALASGALPPAGGEASQQGVHFLLMVFARRFNMVSTVFETVRKKISRKIGNIRSIANALLASALGVSQRMSSGPSVSKMARCSTCLLLL